MDSKKQLIFSVLEFLNDCTKDGTVNGEDVESLEVASQHIGKVFGVNTQDEAQRKEYSIKPASLEKIFNVFVSTQKKAQQKSVPAASSAPKLSEQEAVAKAEELKLAGNTKLIEKNFSEAIKYYTQAIELNPKSAVYYSNRAAAHSQLNDQDSAIVDAIKASELDPKYSKAYSRLGHAYFSKGKFAEAVDAYKNASNLDPNNANIKSALEAAQARAGVSATRDLSETTPSPPASSAGFPMAGMPGMPSIPGGLDFASMMNNPEIMNMAQSFMQSGAYNDMMKDPSKMMEMAQQFMGGAGGQGGQAGNPLASLLNDPNIAEMAEKFKNQPGFGKKE